MAKPLASRLGNVDLVLYREPAGQVRAVQDCCPHRRMPLSLGRVTAEGRLQCGYHGWCFDGSTGQCVAIPNLGAEERVSPSIKVPAFATLEKIAARFSAATGPKALRPGPETSSETPSEAVLALYEAVLADGFVHVWAGPSMPDVPPLAATQPGDDVPVEMFDGEAEVRAPYRAVSEALLFNPGKALGLPLLFGAGDEEIDPVISEDGGSVVARRQRLTLDLPRGSTFDPLSSRTTDSVVSALVDGGLTSVVCEPVRGARLRAVIGLTPINEYRTTVRWRCERLGRLTRGQRLAIDALRSTRSLRRSPSRSIEAVVDAMEFVVDPAVDRIRELRGRPSTASPVSIGNQQGVP